MPRGGRGLGRRGAERKPSLPLKESFRQLVRMLWPFIRPRFGAIMVGTGCLLVGLALGKIIPLVSGWLVDYVLTPAVQGKDLTLERGPVYLRVGLAAGAMLVCAILSALVGGVHTWVVRSASASFVRDLRVHVYRHLQRLSLQFFESRASGDVVARVAGDVGGLEEVITFAGDRLLNDSLNLLVTLGLLFWLEWRLALVAMIPVPLLLLMMRWFSTTIRPVYRATRDCYGEVQAKLQDNISGIRVIKAFNADEQEAVAVEGMVHRLYDAQIRAVRLSSVAWPLMRFLHGFGHVLVIGVGAYLIVRPGSTFTIGSLFAFAAFVMQLYQPIGSLFQTYNSMLQCLAAGERVAELLHAMPGVADAADAYPLPPVRGQVCFTQVAFSYTPDVPVLKEVSFTAEPGQVVALVGRSGAGKTSIVNLVARFYDTVSGQVTVDGHDVRQVTQASLRSQIAVVPQDAFLFNGSVRENIRYARPEATDDEVREAARAAYADSFIEALPNGYEALIGERGVKLSGGQRQRLAIARALLADRRILILDEATSMVDTHAESEIQQALARLMRGRTCFVIAHRLSTVIHADQILVIEDGGVAEHGTHAELLARSGLYNGLCREQFKSAGLLRHDYEHSAGQFLGWQDEHHVFGRSPWQRLLHE